MSVKDHNRSSRKRDGRYFTVASLPAELEKLTPRLLKLLGPGWIMAEFREVNGEHILVGETDTNRLIGVEISPSITGRDKKKGTVALRKALRNSIARLKTLR